MFGFLLGTAVEWIGAHMPELIGIVQDQRAEKKKKEIEQQQKIKIESQITLQKKLRQHKLQKICRSTVIIDTCVWENADKYADFFDALKNACIKNNCKITVLKKVYLEIKKHFNSDDENDKFRARNAKRMIENFLDDNVAVIEDGAFEEPRKGEDIYADSAIRSFALKCIYNDRAFTIITEDSELRISIKNFINRKGKKEYMNVYKISEFMI